MLHQPNVPQHTFTKFFIKTLEAFLARQHPVSNMAKPACMNITKAPQRTSQAESRAPPSPKSASCNLVILSSMLSWLDPANYQSYPSGLSTELLVESQSIPFQKGFEPRNPIKNLAMGNSMKFPQMPMFRPARLDCERVLLSQHLKPPMMMEGPCLFPQWLIKLYCAITSFR